MILRREAIRLLASLPAAAWLEAAWTGPNPLIPPDGAAARTEEVTPPQLAPGEPMSAERLGLIEAFKKQSEGLDKKYEARTYKGDWTMPYRLFRPKAPGKLPLILYLHGSGGLGNDNLKQLALGNVFGTRVWLLPGNQERFPCYVVVPQTDRGWIRYDFSKEPAEELPGLGDGARLALEIVDGLCRELPIEKSRIYVTGQSMGGAGTWHMTAQRPKFFAAAVACCAAPARDNPADSLGTPLWNFHGDSDKSVPVTLSRERITAMRKAGAHPFYTEYAGVDHNVWEWAFTEPALPNWLFSQRRA